MAIYTPGSTAGIPLTVLRSFSAPPPAVVADGAAMRERVLSAVSGLLGLLGVPADPVQSREHILISASLTVVPVRIPPRKSDITVTSVSLAWTP